MLRFYGSELGVGHTPCFVCLFGHVGDEYYPHCAADEERLECHSVTWLYLEGVTFLWEYAEEGFVLGHAFFDLLVTASLSNRRCTRSCSL